MQPNMQPQPRPNRARCSRGQPQPVPPTPTPWFLWGPRCELHELHEETLLSGLAAACGVPASAILISLSLDRVESRRDVDMEMAALLRRGLATGAPAPAVGPSGTAAAVPPEPPLRPEPPPPPPEGFTGVFVAGDAAVTAGADAAGEFNEVDLRGDAVRDLRGSFEIGEMDSLATASSSSLQLSATISLPSRDAAEAAAGWLESAAPGTIAEAVGLHCPPSPPALSSPNSVHSPSPSLSPSPSPHPKPQPNLNPTSTRWATR